MKKITGGLFLSIFILFLFCYGASAQDFNGNTYYIFAYDCSINTLKNFTWTFSDNETGGGDNETKTGSEDNGTSSGGSIIISQQGTTFKTAAGTYLSSGRFYHGSWEATEQEYSSYYEEIIFKYHSFLFYGTTFFDDFITFGIMYTTLTEESTSKGSIVTTAMVPFCGSLVSTASYAVP